LYYLKQIISFVFLLKLNNTTMKNVFALVFLMSSTALSAQTLLPFYWLAGNWEKPLNNKTKLVESWKKQNDSTFVGVSFRVSEKGDTTVSETIELRKRGTAFEYVPTVKNQNAGKPVVFTLTNLDGDSAVFENPQHDFPKRIVYLYNRSTDRLEAAISGGKKRIPFQFDRTTKSQVFEDKDKDTTYVMKQYFVCFLKKGTSRNHTKEEATKIQAAHLAHLNDMYVKGKISIVGPYGDDGDIRGMTIFNVPTIEEAIWWASQDPAVKAGRLTVEVRPWWAAVGGKLK
jgi:uncharacterized protein YciI